MGSQGTDTACYTANVGGGMVDITSIMSGESYQMPSGS